MDPNTKQYACLYLDSFDLPEEIILGRRCSPRVELRFAATDTDPGFHNREESGYALVGRGIRYEPKDALVADVHVTESSVGNILLQPIPQHSIRLLIAMK
jgi:hypothetical protein